MASQPSWTEEIAEETGVGEFPTQGIRNQTVRDPTPEEIRERSAEIRKGWSATRWSKERRRFRHFRWTAPEVKVSRSLPQTFLV